MQLLEETIIEIDVDAAKALTSRVLQRRLAVAECCDDEIREVHLERTDIPCESASERPPFDPDFHAVRRLRIENLTFGLRPEIDSRRLERVPIVGIEREHVAPARPELPVRADASAEPREGARIAAHPVCIFAALFLARMVQAHAGINAKGRHRRARRSCAGRSGVCPRRARDCAGGSRRSEERSNRTNRCRLARVRRGDRNLR